MKEVYLNDLGLIGFSTSEVLRFDNFDHSLSKWAIWTDEYIYGDIFFMCTCLLVQSGYFHSKKEKKKMSCEMKSEKRNWNFLFEWYWLSISFILHIHNVIYS